MADKKKVTYDPRSNRAKSYEQYVDAWSSHARQFTSVFLEAGIPVIEWDTMLDQLQATIVKAADKLQAEGFFNEETVLSALDDEMK